MQVDEIILDLVRRGQRCLRLARELADEYGLEVEVDSDEDTSEDTSCDTDEDREPATTVRQKRGRPPARRMQLIDYLREHGPKKRAEIIEETGMPVGTVAYLLNGEEFTHDSKGRWSLAASLNGQDSDE